MESQVEKLYENAGVRPEYRYDCNVADNIEPEEVFPIRSCSKSEIKGYCSKQYYRYCKVYRVKKTYPPFTAEKQLELIKWMIKTNHRYFIQDIIAEDFSETLAGVFNLYWQDLTEEEKQQVKGILE